MLDDVDISKWQNYYVNLFGAFTLGKPPKMIYVNGVNYKSDTTTTHPNLLGAKRFDAFEAKCFLGGGIS